MLKYQKIMSKKVLFLFCAFCVLSQVQSQGSVDVDPPYPPKPSPVTKPTTTPTAPTNPTNATTTTPITPSTNGTTTTEKPTTPTTKPTTSTSKPTTPTTKPTTPTTKPTTTTAKPTTTTAKPSPTPSPIPTPVGPPAVNNFTGNYTGTNRICLMMKMALQIELMDKNATMMNVTDNINATVSCPNGTLETLKITWGNNSLDFTFAKNNSKYDIHSIEATILPYGANATTTYYHRKPEFSVSEKQSYKCAKDQPLNLTDVESKTTFAKLHISHLQYQAFMNSTAAQYDDAWYCDATNTPDIVPVVVGCVLAVLVVLVLVAYIFGRRRCQARGYLSMFSQERSESDYIPLKTLSCFQ